MICFCCLLILKQNYMSPVSMLSGTTSEVQFASLAGVNTDAALHLHRASQHNHPSSAEFIHKRPLGGFQQQSRHQQQQQQQQQPWLQHLGSRLAQMGSIGGSSSSSDGSSFNCQQQQALQPQHHTNQQHQLSASPFLNDEKLDEAFLPSSVSTNMRLLEVQRQQQKMYREQQQQLEGKLFRLSARMSR